MEQTEKQFSDAIVELATMLGWKVKRDPSWRATAASPGFPDLCMTNGKRVIFAELKVGKAKPTQPQADWMMKLIAAGADYRLWYPADWPEIEEALRP